MSAYKTAIVVADAQDKLDLGFTHIEVWASEDQGGTYREITAAAPTAARLLSRPGGSFRVGGMTLGFAVDGAPEQRVIFSDVLVDWTAQQIVDELNKTFPTLASLEDSIIALTSPTTGRASCFACTYSEAPALFTPALLHGRDLRIPLVSGKSIYLYTDVAGTRDTRYKWRFSKNGVNPVSPFSERVMGDLEVPPPVPVAVATARFVGVDGRPAQRSVLIAHEDVQKLSGYGVSSTPVLLHSNPDGFFQATLVRGARLRVAIEGTSLVRTIVVPDVDSFDLLSAMSEAEDGFNVQTLPPLLTRRSL